jgi:predicted nucleotidyltransferase
MLTKKEQELIKQCAKKYNVSSVLLFGSSVKRESGNDIDIAVKGISPQAFFNFYAELFRFLKKPVDLVDLDDTDSYFAQRILEGGRVIYES